MNRDDAKRQIRSEVTALKAYHLEPEDSVIKLNQNENPFDWPLEVKEEFGRFCIKHPWNRYPTFIPDTLLEGLANYAGVSHEQVLVGNGSNEMLLVLLLSLIEKGRDAIIIQPAFTVYGLLVKGLGGNVHEVLLNEDLSFNADRIAAACASVKNSLLILTSPNNPTGSVLTEAEIRKILDAHTGVAILDQAYIEFGGYNAIPLLAEYPNLIITRTFSKAMAGAGLRIGYMLGDASMIAQFKKIKLPYNINSFSEHCALLMLTYQDRIATQCALLSNERDSLFGFCKALPFDTCYQSGANFFLVRLTRTSDLFEFLKRKGVLVRDVSTYPMLDGCLRISVGTPEENAVLKRVLADFFAQK